MFELVGDMTCACAHLCKCCQCQRMCLHMRSWVPMRDALLVTAKHGKQADCPHGPLTLRCTQRGAAIDLAAVAAGGSEEALAWAAAALRAGDGPQQVRLDKGWARGRCDVTWRSSARHLAGPGVPAPTAIRYGVASLS